MSDQPPPTETPQPDAAPQAKRVPLEREVVLKFEHFSSFIREYSANISLGGMFIKTREPKLRGAMFRFEMRLKDDYPLVAGLGKVLWVRSYDESPERPAGMGVQFLQLEPEGRRLIERIVEEHAAQGGPAFDVAVPPGSAPVDRTSVPDEPGPESQVAAAPELSPLGDLLDPSGSPAPLPSLETPPRDREPRAFAASPLVRLRLMAAVAVAAAVVAALAYLALGRFGGPERREENEGRARPLPRRAAASAEVEEPEPPAGQRAFTVVEEISWRRRDGGAEVLVRLDGSVEAGAWSENRLDNPPRQLVRLKGVSRPYPTRTIEVGFGGVRQVRIGYHQKPDGNELHLVIDLLASDVELSRAEADGSSLRLLFRSG